MSTTTGARRFTNSWPPSASFTAGRRGDLDSACELLGVPREHAAFLLVVTRRPAVNEADGGQLFVNLRAPVVVDTARRTAVQHVLASPGYSVRHPLAAAA